MRISDWSSDVGSSDLRRSAEQDASPAPRSRRHRRLRIGRVQERGECGFWAQAIAKAHPCAMQESQLSQIVTGFLQAPIRNSTFHSGHVLGLSTIYETCQPCAVTQSRTSAQTRA